MSAEPPSVQGPSPGLFDLTVTGDEPLFCHHVFFKLIHMKLSKSPLLGDMDLLTAGELEPGPEEGLSYMLLVLQLGAEGHDDLANVNPGHCALELPKAPRILGWSLDCGGHQASHECPLGRAVSKVP